MREKYGIQIARNTGTGFGYCEFPFRAFSAASESHPVPGTQIALQKTQVRDKIKKNRFRRITMRPLIIAHRGASHVAPENTIAAFRAAHTEGADGIETDVQLTLDGKMVMHHNYSIDANSNGHGLVCQMTEEEVRQYDFGSWKGPEFAGEKIPTLAECLEASKDFQVINIELKAPLSREIRYVERVAQEIRKSGLQKKIIVSAFDHTLLQQMKQLAPEIRVGALTMESLAASPMVAAARHFLPMDVPINQICLDGVTLPAEALNSLDALNIPGADPKAILAEMLSGIGAMFPGATVQEVLHQLQRQSDLVTYMQELDFPAEYLHCEYESCLKDPQLIEKMHQLGIGVNPWTVDGESQLRALIPMGPDGIITNRPDLLKAILAE